MSGEYLPAQKKHLPPGTRSTPERSMLREVRRSESSCAKSSPTTATIFTSVKYAADSAMYVAAPPSMRSTFPCGVSTPSYATEPTTVNDMFRADCSKRQGLFVRNNLAGKVLGRP